MGCRREAVEGMASARFRSLSTSGGSMGTDDDDGDVARP